MAIQFIIDSASDILPVQAQELGLIHLPLKVLFGQEEYADAATLTHKEFYEKLIEGDTLPTCGGINFDKPYALAYSGLSDELLKKYIADSSELWAEHTKALPITSVGCTIGTHVGPGAIAVAFFEN